MIRFLLDSLSYVKELKELNEKNEVVIAVKDKIIEDLESEINELKDKVMENNSLKKRLTKLDNEYQIVELAKGNLIIENDKLKEQNQKLNNDLKYCKKALNKIYSGSKNISIIASMEK